jgi:predicted ATPase
MADGKVPYASSLSKLRQLLERAARDGDLNKAAAAAGLEKRFRDYYAAACEVLGFATRRRPGRLVLSALGREFVATDPGSSSEAALLRRAINASSVAHVVPTLLAARGPTREQVEVLLQTNGAMTASTAEQRAPALLRWRAHVLRGESQLTLTPSLAASAEAQYEGRKVLRALEIQNFKAFGDAKGRDRTRVETPPLTVLAGANGAGKSTVLQALDVLGALVRGNITQMLEAHGWEYADLPHLRSPKQSISFKAEVEVGESVLEWSLTLGTRRHPGIAEEIVRKRAADGRESLVLLERTGRRVTLVRESTRDRLTLPLVTLPQSWLGTLDANAPQDRASFPGLLALKDWAERIRPFWSLDPALLRTASRNDATHVGARGGDLASFLHRLKRRDDKGFRAFVKKVARYYPRLVDIEPRSANYGWKYLAIKERWNGDETSFNAKQVSDGLLRLLAVASIPYWEETPSVVLLDEVENGLHPRLIGGIVQLLEEIAKETQVVATTHSPITLNYVPESSARLVTRGGSGIVRVTPLTETHGYARLRAHFEPGELWYNAGEERLVPAKRGRRT